jgi:hypothetical protein
VNAISAGRWPNSSPTISVNAIIKARNELIDRLRNSLPGVSFVAGSDSAEF